MPGGVDRAASLAIGLAAPGGIPTLAQIRPIHSIRQWKWRVDLYQTRSQGTEDLCHCPCLNSGWSGRDKPRGAGPRSTLHRRPVTPRGEESGTLSKHIPTTPCKGSSRHEQQAPAKRKVRNTRPIAKNHHYQSTMSNQRDMRRADLSKPLSLPSIPVSFPPADRLLTRSPHQSSPISLPRPERMPPTSPPASLLRSPWPQC